MKALTKKILTAIFATVMLICVVSSILIINSKTTNAVISAENGIASEGFYMSNGALVRDSGTNQAGLRWTTNVSDEFLAYLEDVYPSEEIKFGTLVVGKNQLEGDVTTLTKQTPTVANLKGFLDKGSYTASIIYNKDTLDLDWQAAYKAELIARAYVQVGDTIIYAKSEDTQRSMRAVAAEAFAQGVEGSYDDYFTSVTNAELEPSYPSLLNYHDENVLELISDVPTGNYTAYVGAKLVGEVSVVDGIATISGVDIKEGATVYNLHLFDQNANDYVVSFRVPEQGASFNFGAYRGIGRDMILWDGDGTSDGFTDIGDAGALKRLQTYKDAGLTIWNSSYAADYTVYGIASEVEKTWETSNAKRALDLCEKVGLKMVLQDDWLMNLSDANKKSEESFLHDYPNVESLINDIRTCMPYVSHPAFYGVELKDEPADSQEAADRYGLIYRAIKAVYPDIYVHCNLHPDRSAEYYAMYIEAMGIDYLMYDQYPMSEYGISGLYLEDLIRNVKLSVEKGVDFQFVTQALKILSSDGNSNNNFRSLDERDLYWLVNMLIGFGADTIYYYTYYTPQSEDYEDGYSFIDKDGNKTHVYEALQKIMTEMQRLAPVILDYDFNGAGVYFDRSCACPDRNVQGGHIQINPYGTENGVNIVNDDFAKITNVSVDSSQSKTNVALVTELKNYGNYMYMVQDITDPNWSCNKNAEKSTVTLTFSSDVDEIIVYTNGVPQRVVLSGNTYKVTQMAGEAVYIVIPKVEYDVLLPDRNWDDGIKIDRDVLVSDIYW